MHRTNIYLTDEQIAQLDRRARAEGVSRAELIRTLLDRFLESDSDRLSADLTAIDMSFGLLVDVELEIDRTDGARGAHLERIGRR